MRPVPDLAFCVVDQKGLVRYDITDHGLAWQPKDGKHLKPDPPDLLDTFLFIGRPAYEENQS